MRPANPEVLRVLVLAGAGAPVTPPLLPTGSFTVAIASLDPRSAGLDLLTSTACDALIVEGVEDTASIREIVALRPGVPVLVVDSSGYQTAALIREGAEDVLVVVGGTIPNDDIAELKTLGVAEVFTPGAPTSQIVDFLRGAVAA